MTSLPSLNKKTSLPESGSCWEFLVIFANIEGKYVLLHQHCLCCKLLGAPHLNTTCFSLIFPIRTKCTMSKWCLKRNDEQERERERENPLNKQIKKRKNQGTKLDFLEIQPSPIRREWPSKVSLSVKNIYSSWRWFQPL